jgi:hypothetical protein
MGVGFYPVFKPQIEDAVFDLDGKVLARSFKQLDRIASAAGLPAFTSFGDNRPIPEDFDGDPEELEEVLGPWEEWFAITDGLQVIGGILRAINSKLPAARSLKERDEIVEELQQLLACLRIASKRGAQFRLEMG